MQSHSLGGVHVSSSFLCVGCVWLIGHWGHDHAAAGGARDRRHFGSRSHHRLIDRPHRLEHALVGRPSDRVDRGQRSVLLKDKMTILTLCEGEWWASPLVLEGDFLVYTQLSSHSTFNLSCQRILKDIKWYTCKPRAERQRLVHARISVLFKNQNQKSKQQQQKNQKHNNINPPPQKKKQHCQNKN